MRKHTIIGKLALGATLLAGMSASSAFASDDYKPAWLIKGECGHGNIEIKVNGNRMHAPCDQLDTHTGKGYYNSKVCYLVPHGRHYNRHRHHRRHDGHSSHRGHYKHCEVTKHGYQLPVIEIQKFALDEHHRTITTNASESFNFHVSTNGGYGKGFKLKSKEKKYLIVAKDTYTISENAPHYDTKMNCGGHVVHAQSTNVHIDKPGKKVRCVVSNYKKKHERPAHRPDNGHRRDDGNRRDDRNRRDDGNRPARRDGHKPQACVAAGHTLSSARYAYSRHCSVPRRDCDKIDHKWYCSSEVIGNNAPPMAKW